MPPLHRYASSDVRRGDDPGQPAEHLQHRVSESCTTVGIDATPWMQIAQDAHMWYRILEGAEKCKADRTITHHAMGLVAVLPLEFPQCLQTMAET